MSYLVTVRMEALKNRKAIELFCQRHAGWSLVELSASNLLLKTPRSEFSLNLADGRLTARREGRNEDMNLLAVDGQPTDEFNRCAYIAQCQEAGLKYEELSNGDIILEVEQPVYEVEYS